MASVADDRPEASSTAGRPNSEATTGPQVRSWTAALREFCDLEPFRSATVEELVLEDGDFLRRPLRPEDLSFLRFETPVDEDSFDALGSLMGQRVLLCANEVGQWSLPATPDAAPRWRAFHDDEALRLANELRAPLEDHCLGFLDRETMDAETSPSMADLLSDRRRFWSRAVGSLADAPREQALRLLLVQLDPMSRSIDAGRPRLPTEAADLLAGALEGVTVERLEDEARRRGMPTKGHPHWQFYLPGSLACANLLHGLARRPSDIARYVGARLAWEAELLAASEQFGHTPKGAPVQRLTKAAERLLSLFVGSLGSEGAVQLADGVGLMSRLLAIAGAGFSSQVRWLVGIGLAQDAALQISERIASECPDIDRDTFVEPREMCSTTHVHDEHRLVVIESGRMRFWAAPGMRHDMGPGDEILVPKGRLHGSTVLSDTCTYHQPIIPDGWRSQIPAWAAFA